MLIWGKRFARLHAVVFFVATASTLLSCRPESKGKNEGPVAAAEASSQGQNTEVQPTTTTTSPPSLGEGFTCPQFPVVFVHGFLGGSRLGSFSGAVDFLTSKGCKAFHAEVSPLDDVESRGVQLGAQIKRILGETATTKVNIIAHSQGGLDARYAIAAEGLGTSIASLSTLSTPHYGTPLADVALGLNASTNILAKQTATTLLKLIAGVVNSSPGDINADAAIRSLSTTAMVEFNSKYPNDPAVFYQSWGAQSGSGTLDQLKPTLQLPHLIVKVRSGVNDGVVPLSSARWGEYRGTIDADHMDLIGLRAADAGSPFVLLKFLETEVSELAKRGF